ncbi:MAG: peptide ABC transporter substrate-binding protein [Halanaerobiales bacterium]|nr:peptide ABC transporter substrate-binding protein [Halanaerobiales bacterium]
MRIGLRLTILLSLLLVCLICFNVQGAEKIFRYSLRADCSTLDPQLANSQDTSTVAHHIYEGLIRYTGGEIKPGMAKNWEVSADGRVYTFQLREAKWSNGEPVTAYDFEYGIRRLLDPQTGSYYSFAGFIIKNGAKVNRGELPVEELGVKAIDAKTLRIELEQPADYFLAYTGFVSFYPVKKDYVEKHGKEFAADADKLLYNGPFILKEWRHEDRLILVKNPDYWNRETVKLDGAEIIIVTDANTAVSMFENGILDLVDVPTALIEQYRDDVEFYFSGADDFLKYGIDTNPYLKNTNLRRAINYSIDRENFIKLTTNDIYQAGTRYVIPIVSGVEKSYGEEYPLQFYPLKADLKLAENYLKQALDELGLNSPAEIELEFLTTDHDTSRIQAEVLQHMIQQLGIKVEIRQVTYKQRLTMEAEHQFDMVFSGWAPDYDDPLTYLELWVSDGPYNHGGFNNQEYDALIKQAIYETDQRQRMDALFAAEKVLLEEAGICPLQFRRIPYMINPRVKGLIRYYIGAREDFVTADIF